MATKQQSLRQIIRNAPEEDTKEILEILEYFYEKTAVLIDTHGEDRVMDAVQDELPGLFVGSEMFWGKDRMEFVEDELIKN